MSGCVFGRWVRFSLPFDIFQHWKEDKEIQKKIDAKTNCVCKFCLFRRTHKRSSIIWIACWAYDLTRIETRRIFLFFHSTWLLRLLCAYLYLDIVKTFITRPKKFCCSLVPSIYYVFYYLSIGRGMCVSEHYSIGEFFIDLPPVMCVCVNFK